MWIATCVPTVATKRASWKRTKSRCARSARRGTLNGASGELLVGDPLVGEDGALVVGGADVLLGGALEEAADGEDLGLHGHLDGAAAAVAAEVLHRDRALGEELVGHRARDALEFAHL